MGLMETINFHYYDQSDPRVRDWFFLDSIWYPLIITLIYIIVVLKLAPAYMKNRPAYKLNTFIKCYNLFQVITNAYVVKELSHCYPFLRAFECRPIVYSMDPCEMRINNSCYILFWLKVIDLIETVIFILRKKNNQVSFLHLYHHISTFLLGLIYIKYISSEAAMLLPILNSSVHVIMYSYYFLSNFEGPIKQMIIPFKRYMTFTQMGQFIILIIQAIVVILQNCQSSKKISLMMLANLILNLLLFFQFYKKTYIDSKKRKA